MFNYVIEKIKRSEFKNTPFRHLYIENLFDENHFSAITNAKEINIPPINCDSDLFDSLINVKEKILSILPTNFKAKIKNIIRKSGDKVVNDRLKKN